VLSTLGAPHVVAAILIEFTDRGFTVGGGALLTVTGVALAISTIMWLVLLVPAQRVLLRTVSIVADDAGLDRAYSRWDVCGRSGAAIARRP